MSLSCHHLSITFRHQNDSIYALSNIDFSLEKNQTVALVGESGSGKSTLAKALIGLNNKGACEISGSVLLDGRRIQRSDRGKKIGFVFQDPMSALNPTMRIGKQITECLPKSEKHKAEYLLQEMQLPNPKEQLKQYPHQLSGGMRQRVMIAIALAQEPDFLILDEPTTSLDVQTQKQVLDLVAAQQTKRKMGVLLITHNLELAACYTERLYVMYAGKVVEKGRTKEILDNPKHPYTISLFNSIPKIGKQLQPIPGEPPDLRKKPHACAFAPRCPYATKICTLKEPKFYGDDHLIACYLADHNRKPLQKLHHQKEVAAPLSELLHEDR